MRRGAIWSTCAALLLATAGCGGKEEKPPEPPAKPIPSFAERAANLKQPEPKPAPVQEIETFETVTARLKVVGLDGSPLKGMAPIATRHPNAFDEPVATGLLSNDNGETEFQFPGDEKLYIRAWDPEARFFANNYYDAMPNTGNVSNTLAIQMAPGAALEAVLHGADGAPLANTPISAMLYHPSLGAWWPTKGKTDPEGRLRLGPVPPGQFDIELRGPAGQTHKLPGVPLPPAETVSLGALSLQ